jgi:hypothetical protein
MNMQPLTGQKEDGVSFFYRYAVPMAQKRRALERSAYLRRQALPIIGSMKHFPLLFPTPQVLHIGIKT